MQNVILYHAYGGIDYINECRYSLLKYLQVYNLTPPTNIGIIIYADQPEYFEEFAAFFNSFSIREITDAEIKKWKGDINFIHRIKIETIRNFFQSFEGRLLYCDTDTYIRSGIEDIFRNLEAGVFYLHDYEGMLNEETSPAFHKWISFLSKNEIKYNQKKLKFSPQLKIWNAGVIGMNSADKNILEDVLSLTDSLYSKFPKHIAEQLAFSYCFQTAGSVEPAASIAHYWNLKEFRKLLLFFFDKNGEESIANLVKLVHYVDAICIQDEKMMFKKLPFHQRLVKRVWGKGWKIENYQRNILL